MKLFWNISEVNASPNSSPSTFPLYTRHFTSVTNPRWGSDVNKGEKRKKEDLLRRDLKIYSPRTPVNYEGPVPPHTTENTVRRLRLNTRVRFPRTALTGAHTTKNPPPSLDLREVRQQVLSGHLLGLGQQPSPEPSVARPDPQVPSHSQAVPPASNSASVTGVGGHYSPVGGIPILPDWLNLQR